MKKKLDLRIIRTRKLIVQAFVELVEEKGYDQITIQNIADKAMINRATFYAHFKDKQDLYEQIFDLAVNSFASILDTARLVNENRVQVKNIELLLTDIFKKIRKNQTFFLTLIEGSSSELFRTKLAELLFQKYDTILTRLRITENDIDVPIDFIIEYMTSIFIGSVHWWISSNSDFPPEHMARLLIKLIGNGHLTVLGIEIEK